MHIGFEASNLSNVGGMRLNQFRNRLPQQHLAAERHPQGAELAGDDLIFRAAIEVGDLAGAFGDFLDDASDLLLGDVAIVTVVAWPAIAFASAESSNSTALATSAA